VQCGLPIGLTSYTRSAFRAREKEPPRAAVCYDEIYDRKVCGTDFKLALTLMNFSGSCGLQRGLFEYLLHCDSIDECNAWQEVPGDVDWKMEGRNAIM